MSPAIYKAAQAFASARDESLSSVIESLLQEAMKKSAGENSYTAHHNTGPVAQGPGSTAKQTIKTPASKSA